MLLSKTEYWTADQATNTEVYKTNRYKTDQQGTDTNVYKKKRT